VVDVDRQLILAQAARQAPWNDCANLPTLVAQAHQQTKIRLVLADAEFDSERNHTFIREQIRAEKHHPCQTRQEDLAYSRSARRNARELPAQAIPRRRSLVETVSSVVKRKLSCRAPGRTIHTQCRQALLLGLTYNLYRLLPPTYPERMSTEPLYFLTVSAT